MLQIQKKLPIMKLSVRYCDTYWMKKMIGVVIILSSVSLALSSHIAKYSSPLNSPESDGEFKPMVFTHYNSDHISRQRFIDAAQYPEFIPINSNSFAEFSNMIEENAALTRTSSPSSRKNENNTSDSRSTDDKNESVDDIFQTELRRVEDLLLSFMGESGVNGNPELANNSKDAEVNSLGNDAERLERSSKVSGALPRAAETGRLFIFAGLKKILWPIFIGIQIIKSMLFALFLPSIIGTVSQIASQGSASIAGFNRPSETVNNLNFKDNFEDDSKFSVMDPDGYAYNQPEASMNHFSTQLYNAATMNNDNALSRFGLSDQKDTINGLGYENDKKTNSIPMPTSLVEAYEAFRKVPVSSHILSSYDPFYSPILSRLDSVFEELGLKSNNESCREKIVCFMYADPAKYAPYSNLVSAQLSREIDELRKPTSDSPEVLRFFKYMKAAKDGQDGVSCSELYSMCTEFEDFENPAMINAFKNINKLVEARKIY